jgi:hypothetical protein
LEGVPALVLELFALHFRQRVPMQWLGPIYRNEETRRGIKVPHHGGPKMNL